MFSADRSWRVWWLFINSYVGSYSRTLQRLPCSRSAAVKTAPASFDPPPRWSHQRWHFKQTKAVSGWMDRSGGREGATWATGHFDSGVSLDWSTTEMSQWSLFFILWGHKQPPPPPLLLNACLDQIVHVSSLSQLPSHFLSLQTPEWQTFLKSGASIG